MQWRWSTAIPTCNDSGDEPQPSQLHSWLVWRMQFTEETGSWRFWNRFLPYIYGDPQEWKQQNIVEAFAKIKRIEIDVEPGHMISECPVCHDGMYVYLPAPKDSSRPIQKAWCLCEIVEYFAKKREQYKFFTSAFQPARLSEIIDTGNSSVNAAKKLAKGFIFNPNKWMMLYGQKGLGKTHMLRAIATSFGPGLCFYITCADLINEIMKRTGDRTVGEYIQMIQTTPLLLIDDVGAAWLKNSNDGNLSYAMSKLLDIVDFRYGNQDYYPLVVTTNETPEGFRANWGILGDRLIDKLNLIIPFEGESFRQSEQRTRRNDGNQTG